jgi:hypothetical protein
MGVCWDRRSGGLIVKTRLVLALFLAGMGCSGDDPAAPLFEQSAVAGYAKYDTVAKEPVAGVRVDLVEYSYREGYGGGWYPDGWSKSTCTDSKGYFSFKFNANLKRQYSVEAYAEDYLGIEFLAASVDVPPGNTKNATLLIPTHAGSGGIITCY